MLRYYGLVSQSVGPDLKRKESQAVHCYVLAIFEGKLALRFLNHFTVHSVYYLITHTNICTYIYIYIYIYIYKVKQSHYRPGVTQRFPGS